MKIEGTITFGKEGRRKAIKPPKPLVRGRIPRIAKLMALAIKMQGMVDRGEVDGYSELATLAQVSRARMTQIMNLNLLLPSIQERLLFLEPVEAGRDSISLRSMQAVCLKLDWGRQFTQFAEISRVEVFFARLFAKS